LKKEAFKVGRDSFSVQRPFVYVWNANLKEASKALQFHELLFAYIPAHLEPPYTQKRNKGRTKETSLPLSTLQHCKHVMFCLAYSYTLRMAAVTSSVKSLK
jgi:hypothetical protein